MSVLKELLEHNRLFVANHEYEQFKTDKFPDKNLLVLACMDARLVELLPKAMECPADSTRQSSALGQACDNSYAPAGGQITS